MFVDKISIQNKRILCRTAANNDCQRFGGYVTNFDYYDGSSIIKSPKLSSLQREFLIFPQNVIEWSNKNKLTPEGTYLIYLPKSYYDSKNEKYIDTYKLVNEYQKNVFKQRPDKYPQDSYYSRIIPEGYEMKKLYGFVSIVSPENEDLIRQKNSNSFIVFATLATSAATVIACGLYKLVKAIGTVK